MIGVVVSLCMFVGYLTYFLVKYKEIPESISQTYYKTGWLFIIVMWIIAFGIGQYAVFLNAPLIIASMVGLLIVGSAPMVNDKNVRPVHMFGAITCGVCSQLFVILYHPIAMISWLLCLFGLWEKSKITFWIELSCITSLYISIL